MEVGGFGRVAKEQLGPCARGRFLFDLRSCGPRGWLRFSDLGEAKWAVEKMRPLSFSYCLTDLLSPWFSVGVSVSCSLFLSFCLVFHSHLWMFFFFLGHGSQVGRGERWLGNLNAKRYFLFSLIFLNLLYCCIYVIMLILVLYISVNVKLQLPFRLWHCLSSVVIDAVTMKDTCSALQIHVSASKSSAYIFNKGFSRLLF